MGKIDQKNCFSPNIFQDFLFTLTEGNSKVLIMVLVMPDMGKHSARKDIFIALHPGKIVFLPNNCFSPNN